MQRGVFMLVLLLTAGGVWADCDPVADDSRISVAGGSVTEILFALGIEDQIVGVDRTSNYPAAARELPSVGYVRNLSAEGILSLSPTLVIGEHDMGPPDVMTQLEKVGTPIRSVPESFTYEGILRKVRCVGSIVGEQEATEALIRAHLPEPASGGVQAESPRGLIVLTLTEGAPIAAGAGTAGEGFLTIAGARNALDFEGWKPVSPEAMAAAAPDFIVVTDRAVGAAGGIEKLLGHPSLRLTPAAANRRVLTMDTMAMLGFGLRTVKTADELHSFLLESAELAGR